MELNIDYSIIICVYNPDERILSRCLKAIENLDKTGIQTEVILADNNSTSPVEHLNYIRPFSKTIPAFKCIRVIKSGVKFARIAAINESRGKYIVYIDSDNEPEKNYLQELIKLNTRFPNVGAWGPGDITVDFIDGIEKKLEIYARTAFQEKHNPSVSIDSKTEWQACYPFGTGLCSFSSILKNYILENEKGSFTLHGRKGNDLSSGEDTEMVLMAIRDGYAAGSSPTLRLKHLIPKSRANLSYMKRLAYGTSSCYETCLTEIFPEKLAQTKNKIMAAGVFSARAFSKYVKCKINRDPVAICRFSEWLGLNTGNYLALQKKLPLYIRRLVIKLNLI